MKHPGKTPAQRKALDQIGCGNYSPIMASSTRKKMLESGLIEPCGIEVIGTGPLAVTIPQFQMPVSVHMDWCAYQAETCEDEQ